MAKRKVKPKKVFRVYCSYHPDGSYYIGFSSRPDKQFEKYFGSRKEILEDVKANPDSHGYTKEVIGIYEKQSHAKFVEALLQIQYRHDERCLNDMIHIRGRFSWVKEIEAPEWEPRKLI